MKQFTLHGQEAEHVKMSFGALLEERTYKPITFGRIFGMLVALAIMVVGAIKVYSTIDFMGISSFFQRFFSHDYWMWAAMLVGGLIGVIVQISNVIKNRDAKAELFEKGIYIKSDGKELAYTFEDIKNLWIQLTDHYSNGIKTGTTVDSSLETNNGQHLTFNVNMFSKAGDFANAFLHAYESLRFGNIIEDFRAGKPQTFGSFTLTSEGIETPKGMLPWQELVKIETLYGGFTFRFIDQQKKKLGNFQRKDIPNRGIFLDIIAEKVPEIEFKK